MFGAIEHFTGVDISGMDEKALYQAAKDMHVHVDASMGRGKIIDEIFGEVRAASPTAHLHHRLSGRDEARWPKHRTKKGW